MNTTTMAAVVATIPPARLHRLWRAAAACAVENMEPGEEPDITWAYAGRIVSGVLQDRAQRLEARAAAAAALARMRS
jgi:hypothetical protein